MPDLLVNLIVHFGAQLFFGLVGMAAESPAADVQSQEPVAVREVLTASPEDAAAAGAEMEELMARARAAEAGSRQ
jgi:hypothetical protein